MDEPLAKAGALVTLKKIKVLRYHAKGQAPEKTAAEPENPPTEQAPPKPGFEPAPEEPSLAEAIEES